MPNKKEKKLYAYIDESGQDTKGSLFIVSILVTEQNRDLLPKNLEHAEITSKKRNIKWRKTSHARRKEYIEKLFSIENLRGSIFFDTFHESKEYIKLSSLATAKAILKKVGRNNYQVTIFVDGLKKGEMSTFSKGLKDLGIKTRKVRGVKKEENNVFIRLVDALCGLIRDKNDNGEWATKTLAHLIKQKIVSEL
jgi:hypothetical protein